MELSAQNAPVKKAIRGVHCTALLAKNQAALSVFLPFLHQLATTVIEVAVEYRQSALLTAAGFTHAFFTRSGGVSSGPYSSLNFSYSVGDDPHKVDENFARAEHLLKLEPQKLLFVSQVHGADVAELDASSTRASVLSVNADAITGTSSTLGLGVRTADCIPVLLGDPASGRATAVHAGWRGLVCGVIAAAVRSAATRSDRLVAAVGPHIGPAAFEVSDDVAETLAGCSDAEPVERRAEGKPRVNLRAIAQAQLLSCGLLPSHVEHVAGCTFSEPASFFSYRRDGQRSGRHLSVIVPQ